MNQAQIKLLQNYLSNLETTAVGLLINPQPDSIQLLAQHIDEGCANVELNFYKTQREQLIALEQDSAKSYYPEEEYQEIIKQDLITVWVDGLSNHQVELALQFKQL